MEQMTTSRDPFSEGDLFLKHFLPGDSDVLRNLRGVIYRLNTAHKNRRMVPSILLRGERGSGKSYVANLIAAHLWWLRSSKGQDVEPDRSSVHQLADQAGLRTQTMTALPETLAESILFGAKKGAFTDAKADRLGVFDSESKGRGGSEIPDPFDVFLDEIGDTPEGVQAKLLEVLETGMFRPLGSSSDERSRTTDARIIVATNRDLEALVTAGKFRADLYDRLSWVHLVLPPLREQLDQLPAIVRRVNEGLCLRYKLGEAIPEDGDVRWAQKYFWPGNHRELVHVLWEWHLFEGKRGLKEIVDKRSSMRIEEKMSLDRAVTQKVFDSFDDVLAQKKEGFKRYGDIVNEIRKLTYAAIYRYNRDKQLKDEDIRKLFTRQKPTNVRKQISQNRPRGEEE
jgi:transcriptional regulator with GAF, ATPase, and Fis domain